MNDDENMFGFVKEKLEEGEGISSESLSRILAASEVERKDRRGRIPSFLPRPFLAAASLAVAACGWYFVNDFGNARREADVANVIALLSAADGDDVNACPSLSDALYAWQDAPTRVGGIPIHDGNML